MPPSGRRALTSERVLVLTACALIEPFCLPLSPVFCRCPDRTGVLLDLDVEGPIGVEVGLVDLVLAIRISGNERHHLVHTIGGQDGEFSLDGKTTHLGLVSTSSAVNRCCGLTPIHYLEVAHRRDSNPAFRKLGQLHARSGSRYAVVVCKETLRLLEYGLAHLLIDLTSSLKEQAHITLQ